MGDLASLKAFSVVILGGLGNFAGRRPRRPRPRRGRGAGRGLRLVRLPRRGRASSSSSPCCCCGPPGSSRAPNGSGESARVRGRSRRWRCSRCPSGCGNPYHLHMLIMAGHLRGAGAEPQPAARLHGPALARPRRLLRHRRLRLRAAHLKLEWSSWIGLARRRRSLPGAGRLGHRPARAQAARRVLRAAHHQLRRRDLAGERELDGADQRPARPARRAARSRWRCPGCPSLPHRKPAYYYLVLVAVVVAYLRVPSRSSHSRVGRALGRAARERDPGRVGRHRRHALSRAGRGGQRGDGRRRRAASTRTTRASSARRSSSSPTR